MVYWFTGQPHSGKSTLARYFKKILSTNFSGKQVFWVDGDDLRKIINNQDYSEQGRRNNISNAIAIAKYLDSLNHDVIVSLVSPYRDMREQLKKDCNVIEIYVHTTEIRGRENFHVENYEKPLENFIEIDTTDSDEFQSLNELLTKLENHSLWKTK